MHNVVSSVYHLSQLPPVVAAQNFARKHPLGTAFCALGILSAAAAYSVSARNPTGMESRLVSRSLPPKLLVENEKLNRLKGSIILKILKQVAPTLALQFQGNKIERAEQARIWMERVGYMIQVEGAWVPPGVWMQTSYLCALGTIPSVPQEIGLFDGLTRLDISKSNIVVLPPEIGQCKSLITFRCVSNKLESIPDSIIYLKNLERLELTDNRIRRLPKNIGALEKLNRLLVDQNQLDILPDSLAFLCPMLIYSVWDNPGTQIMWNQLNRWNGDVVLRTPRLGMGFNIPTPNYREIAIKKFVDGNETPLKN